VTDFATLTGPDQTVTIPGNPTPTVSSHITSPRGKVKAKKLNAIKGTADATLGVARVQVAVVEVSGGARIARKGPSPACEQLGGDGKLHKLHVGRHKLCTPTTFVTASGTNHWTLKLKRHLPKGNYVAISRAVDTAGHVETTGAGDRASFQVI
jgi:hypothetical protein